jgi:hypothetical protein
MNRIDAANVYEFVTGKRSTQNARSRRSVGTACPGRSAAPPRPVGVRE